MGDDTYFDHIRPIEKEVRVLAEELAKDRTEEISSKAWDEYNTQKAEAEDQLAQGYKELKNGAQELAEIQSEADQKLSGAYEDLLVSELKFTD